MNAREIWIGSDPLSTLTRAALWPLSLAYGLASGARRALYAAGALPVHAAAVPCISIGNLTAGGTGKTPVAAWLAARLHARARTAIVLRDYRGDESEVHRRLNPAVMVVANPDRVAGVRQAREAGARVAVLDDAFQHRRIARVADVALLALEQVRRPRRLLPAGPWREPLSAAGRADLLVLTRKSGSAAEARQELERLAARFPSTPTASVYLAPGGLEGANGREARPLDSLRGAAVLAIAAIGEPLSFRQQLDQLGARTTLVAFNDHHAFTSAEAQGLAATAPDALAVCTLKDAVKLAPLWPASRALWYVSQRLVVEEGAEHFDRLCARVLEHVDSPIAG